MRSTAKSRILQALRAAGRLGATTAELAAPDVGGVRFGGRIKELRDAGYEIEAFYVRRGSHKYVLVSEPVEVGSGAPEHPPASGTPDAAGRDAAHLSEPAEVSPTARHGGAVGADLGAEECSQTRAPTPPDETNDGRFPSGGEGPGLFDADEFKPKRQHDQIEEAA